MQYDNIIDDAESAVISGRNGGNELIRQEIRDKRWSKVENGGNKGFRTQLDRLITAAVQANDGGN